MKKSPSLRSTGSVKSVRSETGGQSRPLIQQGQQPDVAIPEKRTRSLSSTSPIDAKQIKAECYIDDETKDSSDVGAMSPSSEKDEKLKENSEDDLKLAQLGTLYFTVEYDKHKTALVVTISRACDLPAKDPNVGSSDPYVKLQLLPEKRHKVKTRVLRKTLNPVYDEIFTFYGLSYNQLPGITLHFVMLSFDRFSRDDIIGEVIYPLSGVDLSEQEVSISKEIAPRHMKVRLSQSL